MSQAVTVFGSLKDYTKGTIELVSGEARHYVFSNIFEVASKSRPYERVVVGKNLEYVQEVMRAEGVSPWFACGHDEFALCMDGEVTVEFVKLKTPPAAASSSRSAKKRSSPACGSLSPTGLGRGHEPGSYRFRVAQGLHQGNHRAGVG